MGYIKKVVDTGVEFADNYKMPEYVAKARESSKIIDAASLKIENFYCEKGSPLLQMVDELTATKINAALETSQKAKQESIEKYEAFKMFSRQKADETKTIMWKGGVYVSEEASRFEKKLVETAAKNEYTNKVMQVFMTAKEQVKEYSDAFVKKSLSLPLTLQDRMDKGLSFGKEKVGTLYMDGSAVFEEKKTLCLSKTKELKTYVRTSYGKMYGKMTSDNALVAVRKVFGDKAALFTETKLQELKKANIPGAVSKKFTEYYKYSTAQVAQIREKMEEKYLDLRTKLAKSA
jgi:hypothetical protein